ncbi:MAG: hypothetical protein KME54_20590 [Tolypothrix brevis GSE-NOS-MK-07-07A]|nr:hypothetical protein [Tolypothrix brevis GSE-NOS-MK-07-07A]
MLHCHKDTVCEARKRLVTRGFAAALERKRQDRLNKKIPQIHASKRQPISVHLRASAVKNSDLN